MPFLRRRGNMASENDMRRHTLFIPSSASQDQEPLPAHLEPRPSDDTDDNGNDHDNDNGAPLSRPPTNHSRRPRESHESQASAVASQRGSPDAVQPQNTKHRRFSILRFRNASDSQLSLRAKQQAEDAPPVPRPPAIITTAPTVDLSTAPKKVPSRINLAAKLRRSTETSRTDEGSIRSDGRKMRKSFNDESGRPSLAIFDGAAPSMPSKPSRQGTTTSNGTTLTASTQRQSESYRSDASSVDRISQSSPATTPKRSATPFFKLRRNKKAPEPLFPLAHLPQKNAKPLSNAASSTSLNVAPTPRPATAQSPGTPRSSAADFSQPPMPLTAINLPPDTRSGHSSPTRTNLLRGRSSTMSSMNRDSTDEHLRPPNTRTSSSTGRKSFGDLLGISRLRQNSDLNRQGTVTPATPGSIGSKSNSLQLPRRASFSLPDRNEDESPAKYLARLEDLISRGIIAATLSKGTDPFSAAVLRSYMRSFSFFGDPMDMAIRKLLMEAELPKETQQIDRCLQAFANRYHECNPGIYFSPDQAYFIAFSILILHTDVFNKNNKHKMQKLDYLKNTKGEGISDDILECFYDNISYTPFIHVEDDLEFSTELMAGNKLKRKPAAPAGSDPAKRATKEPIDPYTLILDKNLDALRPNLKDAMEVDDHYDYMGSAMSLNMKDLQKTFFRTGVLQIVSARSRPDAFMSEKTATNPEEAHPGIVDIKVTKVGLLWRKEAKKRKTRSPWHEWGAILTGAQLYFFRNTSWVKNLMHQYENHIKTGNDGIPVIFKPPLEEFKPDALMSTHGAVALLDTSYKKHKNAFVYVRQGGLDEVLLADNEEERSDWLAKLNYAAAFRTSGVKMRGVVGGNYDGQGRRGIRRLDSTEGTQLVQTPTGPVSIVRGKIDHKMAEDIQTARRDITRQKIDEADRKLEDAQKQLEEQLRNARHLQILAPIQPRSREQLLLAAARISAQLKWTRLEMWKERCHRDILAQDLLEDGTGSVSTPTKRNSTSETTTSPMPRQAVSRTDSKATSQTRAEKSPQSPKFPKLESKASFTGSANDVESSSNQEFETPPQSVAGSRRGSHDILKVEPGRGRRESGASYTPSLVQSPASTVQAKQPASRDGPEMPSSPNSRDQDDVDADERDFLRQAGLLERTSSRDPSDKATISTVGDSADQVPVADRDKLERSKIRRSLQRTLRESAGHLSHHRSKRGKDHSATRTSEDTNRDSMLARGTGSFVVHGKKASVINLGTELQNMSQDEKIRARKLLQQQQQANRKSVDDQALSPVVSLGKDEDFQIIAATPPESNDSGERRGSIASASTATARSFRELHRKYSTAQATRSVSSGGRLAVPSDGESETALSFSEGRRSPLPTIANEKSDIDSDDDSIEEEEDEEEEDDDDDDEGGAGVTKESQPLTHGVEQHNKEGEDSEDSEDSSEEDDESSQEPKVLARRAMQAV